MSCRSVFRPRSSTSHREIPPSQLAARCKNTQPDASHEPFCFELFRRAIAENCTLCWHYLHSQYYPLVRYWISQHTSVDTSTLDDLTQKVFIRFWRYYTSAKLNQAENLAQVLTYLKRCAVSAAIDSKRQAASQIDTVEWDEQNVNAHLTVPSTEASAFQGTSGGELWTLVEISCKNEREQLIARLTFLAHWKPRDIAEHYPRLFPDVQDVYRIKRNLLDRLRRDPELQAMHKKPPSKRLIE